MMTTIMAITAATKNITSMTGMIATVTAIAITTATKYAAGITTNETFRPDLPRRIACHLGWSGSCVSAVRFLPDYRTG